ncbi:MAG: S41 family peptidase [Clostridia bacterium]|nr:S41 family peptidase [Clostridia bacterium]
MEYINQSEPYQTELRSERRIRTILWILIPVIWVLSLILVGVAVYIATKPVRTDDEALMDAIRDMRYCIRENYYFYDEDEEKLTNAALKGMASGTGDDYAYYYSAEEYAALQKQNEGNFVGIGILTSMDENGAVRIIDVYDNTPASEAGLTAGDQMIEINGVSYEGLDLNGFLGNVIAEDGAENTIKVLRDGEELTFTIVAREVHTPSVSYRMLTDTIGYIRVSTFHGTCVQETEDALKDLKEQGMTALVFDLRDNLGGSLYDALDIADFFLPKNHVITSLRSRSDEEEKFYTKTDGMDIPMVLLVNGYSASASELVAGALKDYDAAYLIGTTTFGKGIVQSYFGIPETNGMLKITTEAYYTPNGVCVHGTGIEPDQVVELSEEAQKYSITMLPFELDTQLQAAIGYLETH